MAENINTIWNGVVNCIKKVGVDAEGDSKGIMPQEDKENKVMG